MNKSKRNRSVNISPKKVRSFANDVGFNSFVKFELEFLNKYPELGADCGTPKKVWESGKRIDLNRARKVADLLGVEVGDLIEGTNFLWKDALNNLPNCTLSEIISIEWCESNSLNLIDFNDTEIHDDIVSVPIEVSWFLHLTGEEGKYATIILRSEYEFMQLSPLVGTRFDNLFSANEHTYPSLGKPLKFDKKKGGGWRELIVLIADDNLLNARDPQQESLQLTRENMQQLVHNLQSTQTEICYQRSAFFIEEDAVSS